MSVVATATPTTADAAISIGGGTSGMRKTSSVNDFESMKELTEALESNEPSSDWKIYNYDINAIEGDPNCLKSEAERLLALKSYNILDTGKEIEFESLTKEAQAEFNCPVVLMTLLDLGRTWIKSAQGVSFSDDSIPRCHTFCSHVVKMDPKHVCLVVPDATQDERFSQNPLVTSEPKIRFYAGVPMITPEGQRIGTFSIVDVVAHPEGLSDIEVKKLKSFAEEAVYHMITRSMG